jgi:sterol desaturase/sphingolipid hydroxylase (fatty acid hydroxylase superfamily)
MSAAFAGGVAEAAQRGASGLTSDFRGSGGAAGAAAAFAAAVALQSVLEYVRAAQRLLLRTAARTNTTAVHLHLRLARSVSQYWHWLMHTPRCYAALHALHHYYKCAPLSTPYVHAHTSHRIASLA